MSAASSDAPKPRAASKGRKKGKKKAKEEEAHSESDDSPDEAEKLLALDEAFTLNAAPDAGDGDAVYDPLDSLAAIPALKGHRDAIRAVAFDEESNTLFTASWDETVAAWDLLAAAQVGLLPHGVWVNAVLTTRLVDGVLRVVTGAEDGHLTLWQQHESQTGKDFVVAGQWRLSYAAVTCMCLHENSTVFAAMLDRVTAFSLISGSQVRAYKLEADANCIVAVDELLYCACDDGRVTCLDIVGGFALRQLVGHTGPVRQIVAAETYNTLYTAGDDGSVRVWMLSTGQCTKTWRMHKRPVTCMSLHVGERDRFLYTGSTDGTVRCTRLASGTTFITRHCVCTAMLAVDVVDPAVAERQREARRQMLTPEAIAARNLRRASNAGDLHLQVPGRRRMSVQETAIESITSSGGGTLVCGDYRGHVYPYPTSGTEAGVTMLDFQRVQQRNRDKRGGM